MSGITGWIMCILSIVILGVILDLLLNGTRVYRLIQTIFATVTILVIIMPIPGLIKSSLSDGEFSIFNLEIQLDEGYLNYVNRLTERALEQGVVASLEADGFKNVEVKITAVASEVINIIGVELNLQNLVIDKNYLHINKYEYVRDKVSEYLKIQKDIIIIYG